MTSIGRELAASLASLAAPLLVSACSSPSSAQLGSVRGTYEAESSGALLWIDFTDASHYELLKSTGCSLGEGASMPCFRRGTYAFNATETTLTLSDETTGQRTSMPFHVEAFAPPASSVAPQGTSASLHLEGDGLTSGGANLLGPLPLAWTVSIDNAVMRLVSGSTSLVVTDAAALVASSPSGYLVASSDSTSTVSPTVLCGATLIRPNVVITAAHCATKAAAGSNWFFGVGDVGGPLYAVTGNQFHNHAAYVDSKAPNAGLGAKLRENDLAYLVLDKSVPGVTPASIGPSLSRDCPGGSEGMVTYRPARQEGTACVELALTLPAASPDAIYEVHPLGGPICPADGDDGSPLYVGDKLVGIFAGSVAGLVMDCTSYLNGYESMAGHQSFVSEAMAAGGS